MNINKLNGQDPLVEFQIHPGTLYSWYKGSLNEDNTRVIPSGEANLYGFSHSDPFIKTESNAGLTQQ